MRTYRFVALLMLLDSTAVASNEPETSSSAQENCPKVFKEALATYQRDDAQTAVQRLKLLWSAHNCYQIAALLGQSELTLERYRDAAEHLSIALRGWHEPEPPKNRQIILNALARAKARIGTLQITVNHPGAEVSIDGERIAGTSPVRELFVNPGTHRIRAARASYGAIELSLKIQPGEQQPIELHLNPHSVREPVAAAGSGTVTQADAVRPSAKVETRERHWYHREDLMVLAGGGALAATAVGAGVYFQVRGNQSRDRAKQLGSGITRCAEAPEGQCAELRDAIEERGRNYTTAKVFYGIGAAIGFSTTVLAFVLPSETTASKRTAVKGWLSPSSAGILLSGRF